MIPEDRHGKIIGCQAPDLIYRFNKFLHCFVFIHQFRFGAIYFQLDWE